MISLRQLRYLDSLATHLHFRKASEAVAVSQPALSMQIKELEAYLGVKLFERLPNSVRLTREGEEVAARARAILTDVQDLTDYARQAAQPLSGPLRLGIIPSIAPYLLPRILPILSKGHPDLRLTIRETMTQTLREELQEGKLDAIIIALPADNPSFISQPLFIDRFLLARSNGPKLNRNRRVQPQELEQENILLLEEGHCLRDQALNYCQNISTANGNTLGATSLATVMQMVAAGYGVTLLPEICAEFEVRDDRVALLRFEEPQPARTVGLVWRKSSPRAPDFTILVDTLRETVSKAGCKLAG